MSTNQFFTKQGPIPLKRIIEKIKCPSNSKVEDFNICGVESLENAKENDLTFLNSSKYKKVSLNTKAGACITTINLSKFLPDKCIKLNVKNTLLAVTQVSKMFYPKADLDYPDTNLVEANKLENIYSGVNFGKNVLIGADVRIGKNTIIGNNTVVESNVTIGEKCLIGSNVTIRNTLISNDVHVQDGSRIGIKGFGFIPLSNKNLRTPHIARVILEDGVEIGANCTINRGSLTDTTIGANTFIDDQVHVAHNVKIGKNCMFAAQVGIAGSTTIGDNVSIGGQSGISGHLRIGNNIRIGGGSGVMDDIADNSQVMGYPAVPLRVFVKDVKR